MKLPPLLVNRPGSTDPAGGAYDPDAHLQWWYFDAFLENGHRLLTFFLPRFLGSLEGNEFDLPMLDIVLSAPGGEIVRERRFFRKSDLSASRDRFTADFGPDCSVRLDPGKGGSGPGLYRLRAGGTGRIRYELEIAPELPPWAPTPNGRLPRVFLMLLRRSLTTRDSFHYVPFVPRGRLRGRITVDGRSLDARGTAYHEQGRLSFSLARFLPAWYWLHIEHPPWTILSGTALPPAGFPRPARGALGGIGFVQKGKQCLLAAFDPTGILVRWPSIAKQDPAAEGGEKSMAWDATVRLARPGLRVRIDLRSRAVLEYLPFAYRQETPVKQPYWGQTVADAEVEVILRKSRSRFQAQGVLETMVTGSPQQRLTGPAR